MSGLKFLTEAHEAGTSAKVSYWFVGVTNGMVAGTATRLEMLFATQEMPTSKDEKAPMFDLSRACWDSNPALPRICGDCQATLDRGPCGHLRTTKSKRTKLEENCEGLRR